MLIIGSVPRQIFEYLYYKSIEKYYSHEQNQPKLVPIQLYKYRLKLALKH